MKALAADGVSFAIPIDSAIKIVEQLKKHRLHSCLLFQIATANTVGG
jgi:S1-C subfamily serine protease